jgi:transposase-like protein
MADELFLTDPRFTDPEAAAEYLESIRWPDGVVCPKCGESEREPYRINVKSSKRRLWKCRACRKQFTVMVGTIFESSHVPLNKWLLAFYLLCASKKGMSAHQLYRMLKLGSYKTAWFMFHRIREAMREPAFAERLSGVVEVDETYIGGKPRSGGKKVPKKVAVMALVERGGKARASHVADVTASTLQSAIYTNVDRSARMMSDQHVGYLGLNANFSAHGVVKHSVGEYVRGDVHTQSVEGFFANLKRGVNGIYHHVSPAHLDRYLDEFSFRWNSRDVSDGMRTAAALVGAEGKRLKYQQPGA